MNDAQTKGFDKGKKEGEKLGIEKTAIAMLKKGMPIALIAEISQLSVEEIEKLKETL
jgi:predicted transposase YdaD